MENKIESKIVLKSALWRFGERISAQIVSFVVSIILARILMPSEYGIVTMTTVFITICNVFVTSGFGMALVQKKEVENIDFSTVLYMGIAVSIILYTILFLGAEFIAKFYDEPILKWVLRIMALRLPIAAINSIQQAYVSRKMMFEKFFFATLIGTIVSAIIGIGMAVAGYGVWALVAQYLSNSFIDTIILGITIKWKPVFKISFKNFKELFGFGWRILASDLLHTIYTQIRSLVIGKQYSKEQLAYYNKGQQIPHMFVTNVGVAISTVLFPAMSTEQDNMEQLFRMLKRSISLGTFVLMPIMAGLAAISESLTVILLTEKWLPAVPFMQMACIEFCVEPWANANLQAIKAQGKSKEYLKLEFLKKSIAIILLIIAIPFGVYAIAWSGVLYALIDVIIDVKANKKFLGYGVARQFKEISHNIVLALVVFVGVFIIGKLEVNIFIKLLLQVIVGSAIYFILGYIICNENFMYIYTLIKKMIRGKRI